MKIPNILGFVANFSKKENKEKLIIIKKVSI